jgi:hypothetical protein
MLIQVDTVLYINIILHMLNFIAGIVLVWIISIALYTSWRD